MRIDDLAVCRTFEMCYHYTQCINKVNCSSRNPGTCLNSNDCQLDGDICNNKLNCAPLSANFDVCEGANSACAFLESCFQKKTYNCANIEGTVSGQGTEEF